MPLAARVSVEEPKLTLRSICVQPPFNKSFLPPNDVLFRWSKLLKGTYDASAQSSWAKGEFFQNNESTFTKIPRPVSSTPNNSYHSRLRLLIKRMLKRIMGCPASLELQRCYASREKNKTVLPTVLKIFTATLST